MKAEHFLNHVESRLNEVLSLDSSFWKQGPLSQNEAARHLCLSEGAKRARPLLLSQFGLAVNAPEEELIDLAVAVELLHSASLLHDDVVDLGTLRRGKTCANVQWGNTTAVLTGDLILSLALLLLKDYPQTITTDALGVVSSMSRSAMNEVNYRGQTNLCEQDWRELAEGKTGKLFAWCGQAPALLLKDPVAYESFRLAGTHLGIAFQMADDLKDIKKIRVNKDRFADIKNKNPNLPIIFALQSSKKFRAELEQAWLQEELSEKQIKRLGELVLETGAMEYTENKLQQELSKSLDFLEPYIDLPGGKEIASWARSLWQSLVPQPHLEQSTRPAVLLAAPI